MKSSVYFFFSMLVISVVVSNCSRNTTPDIVYADSKQAVIKIDGKITSSWTIAPEVNPDIYTVEVEKGKYKDVQFVTDRDSVSYRISWNNPAEFIVLVNDRERAFTRFEAVTPKAVFTEEYIQRKRGKVSVDIVEAQELLQVIFAITPTGLADTRSRIINHDTTDYYLSVLEHFLPY